jgi:hypothetical protein
MKDDPPDTDRDVEAAPTEPAHEHIARLHHTLHAIRTGPTPGFEPATVEQAMVKESIALAGVHAHVAFINEAAAVAVFTAAYRQASDRGTKPSSGISPQRTAS